MRHLKTVGLLAMVGYFLSCVPVLSSHRFFTDKDLTFDPDLTGRWLPSDDEYASIEFIESPCPDHKPGSTGQENRKTRCRSYKFIIHEEDGRWHYVAHLFELHQQTFLDAYPDTEVLELMADSLKFSSGTGLVQTFHALVKVERRNRNLTLSFLSTDWFKEYLKDGPTPPTHFIHEDTPILTDNTVALQAFVSSHLDDKDLFEVFFKGAKKRK